MHVAFGPAASDVTAGTNNLQLFQIETCTRGRKGQNKIDLSELASFEHVLFFSFFFLSKWRKIEHVLGRGKDDLACIRSG